MTPRLILLSLCLVATTSRGKGHSEIDFDEANAAVLALASLVEAPMSGDVSGKRFVGRPGEMQELYFDALPYEGERTRVFALVQLPKGASEKDRVPGIVLVHGGGGSAFQQWVELWVKRGYAAISIAVEGQTDERIVDADGRKVWARHSWAGPQRDGIYGDMSKPIEEQWMYHAVADTILANSLLRALPEVDESKVGLMGVSWGGVIASTVVGIDDRFAFAIPVYGCGHKFDSANQYGRALGRSEWYRKVWDPMVRLPRSSIPMFWMSWPEDKHFPMDAQAASYRAAQGPRMVSLIPGMKHGHAPAWLLGGSYAFADSAVWDGGPWAKQTQAGFSGVNYFVSFETMKTMESSVLVWTEDSGYMGNRTWIESPAELKQSGEQWVATAALPKSATAWFLNLKSGKLVVSSEFEERR